MSTIPTQFTAALDALVGQLRHDRSIIAVVLCGSLSHDTVWARSDIDLVLVTIDDAKVQAGDVALNADGVNVHALLMPRAEFRKTAEGAVGSSFFHSFLAKGRLLYTHDPTITDLLNRLASIGERDTGIQLLNAGIGALPCLYKARKWLTTRGDLDYTSLWLLYAATPLAQVEVISARKLVDREVIPQAQALNPAFFRIVYTDLLNTPKTRKRVEAALESAEKYIAERAESLFRPVLDYLKEAGDTRAASEIEHHFKRTFGVEGVMLACEYLADEGYLGKVSAPVRATKKSTVSLQELAFFHAGAPDGK